METFISGPAPAANGVKFAPNGTLYVSDISANGTIKLYSAAGQILSEIGSVGIGNGQFQHPQGIAFDTSGDIYVADLGNHRVQKFTTDGVFVLKWCAAQPVGVGQGITHPARTRQQLCLTSFPHLFAGGLRETALVNFWPPLASSSTVLAMYSWLITATATSKSLIQPAVSCQPWSPLETELTSSIPRTPCF